MAKRPSYVSIRRRQRNIIEGMGTRDIKYKQAAKELGVTQSELRKFLETKPTVLRRNFNRSPVYTKLYKEGQRAETRRLLGVKRIREYPFLESVIREPRIQRKPEDAQIGRMIQRLYYINNIGPQNWSTYTREHNLPNSIKAIKLLYRNNRITRDQYTSILKEWRNDYPGMTDQYYSSITGEDVSDYEVEAA